MANLQGQLVRLAAFEVEKEAPLHVRWSRDAEFMRLFGYGPTVPFVLKNFREYVEKEVERDPYFLFSIHTLATDQPIGIVDLEVMWVHQDAWLGIGMGEREFWGKGYGTEAMQLVLDFAFNELNLHRVTLNVFDFNRRAMRSYEKSGFVHEGRARNALGRDGQRYDSVFMGILQSEWRARAAQSAAEAAP